ncbi:MAG TPA: hypothetical protein VK616_15885 [Flavitalea sp.]|nr:hypothetical protein [Flavitalea sp.]
MNKFLIPAVVLLFTGIHAEAQQKAVTDNGDQVVLYADGTWKAIDTDSSSQPQISVNTTPFTKSGNSTFLVKSNKANVGVWINAKKWNFKKGGANEDVEYQFAAKGKDVYGMMIAERIEIPIESLAQIALQNAQKQSADIYIVKQEYRMVNGKKMLLMQMNGTIKGIKFSYYGYYYSNSGGTVQMVTYTAQNLLQDQLANAEELLNGLALVE